MCSDGKLQSDKHVGVCPPKNSMENCWIFLDFSDTGFLQLSENREKGKGSEGCHCCTGLVTEQLKWEAGQVSRTESWGSHAGGNRLVLPIRAAGLSVPDSRNQPQLATGCKRQNCSCRGANAAVWSMQQKGKFTGQNFQAARWSSVAVLRREPASSMAYRKLTFPIPQRISGQF